QRVAYHEAGHALVACSLPNTHPVHKISIIPRGVGALGYVLSRPDEDRYLVTQSELESQIKVALGGTLAEELVYREISNGATSDLEQASRIARSMVKEFGMSRLGRVNFQERSGPGFLGPAADWERSYSERTAREIDLEVRQIIEDATRRVPRFPPAVAVPILSPVSWIPSGSGPGVSADRGPAPCPSSILLTRRCAGSSSTSSGSPVPAPRGCPGAGSASWRCCRRTTPSA